MWKAITLSAALCAFLTACDNGGGNSNKGNNSGNSNSSSASSTEKSNLPTGTPVAVLDTSPSQGVTLVLEEVDTTYTSRIHSTTHSNGSTYYLAAESSQIAEKNSHTFIPAYFIDEDVICLSTADIFNEVRVNISYGGTVTNDVLIRGCGLGEVDFTAFDNADLIASEVAINLLSEPALTTSWPFGPAILQSHRDEYIIASKFLLDFETVQATSAIRFFPSGFSFIDEKENWTYTPAFLDRTSGHLCVPEIIVGGYMMAYASRDTSAVNTLGDRLILDLFSDGSSLNPEAMIYWGAKCE